MVKVIPQLVCLVLLASCAMAGEIVVVPATSIDGAWTSELVSGQSYMLTASGVFDWDTYGNWADAEWFYSPHMPQNPNEYGASDYIPDIFDLCINNTPVEWIGSGDGITWTKHTYSPSHVYKYVFTAPGGKAKLHIADIYPFDDGAGVNRTFDNSGHLLVDITTVPEPSSVLILLCGVCGLCGIMRRRKR